MSDKAIALRLASLRPSEAGVEYLLWVAFALLINGGIWLRALIYGRLFAELFVDSYITIILAVLILLFPLLFRQIFGRLPFQLLRDTRRVRLEGAVDPQSNIVLETSTSIREDIELERATKSASDDPIIILAKNAVSSDKLARNIYTRSGVYMMIGALVAFSGLLFFYFQTASLQASSDIVELVTQVGPKFGILIFIEVVAFFFLRQYRSAMDEFRYFEAIKRRREETLAIIKLNQTSTEPIHLMELLKSGVCFSGSPSLRLDETTEILEARKLERNELAIIEKIIDALSVRKA